jgi:WXG100 family type VII secretion target
MPDMSNIDSEKILSTVGQLDGIIDRMSGCVGKIDDAIARLDKGWVSEVKSGFMANYQNDRAAMQEMLGQLHEISTTLREAAADFDKTESEMLGGANALC